MALVRELKALNARKKAGEELSGDEEGRRKELKTFLKSQLEGGGGDGAASPVPVATAAVPAPVLAAVAASPRPIAAPPPRPVTLAAPPQTPAPITPPPRPAYVPRKDVFAISGADSFIDAAMDSEVVAKTDPWANRRVHASEGDIADAEAAADAAVRAQRKRERATAPEDVEAQLKEVATGYTPPSDDYCLEQYYGDYFSEGLQAAHGVETAGLVPVDPREVEVRRAVDIASAPGSGETTVTVPPGLAFLDDFAALYTRRILEAPAANVVPMTFDDPTLLIGARKVTVHLLNGEKKQGAVKSLRRGELGFRLDLGATSEEIALSQVKAVFVHLQPNSPPPSSPGKSITVMFNDRRSVQGDSPDYASQAPVFSLIPSAGRGQFEKIIINAGAVASVS